jgi:NitT/TauT family transport system permease protein
MTLSETEAPAARESIAGQDRGRVPNGVWVWTIRVCFVAAVLISWQETASHGLLNPIFTGSPTGIYEAFIDLFKTSIVTTDLRVTLTETLIGFALSIIIGLTGAYILNSSVTLEKAFRPIISGANAVPRIALVPLFIIWFGLGPDSKIANIVSFVSFTVLINSLEALKSADRDFWLLSRMLGFSERQRIWKFVVPGAIPVFGATFELALIYSFLGAITGEILGGINGLGVQLETAANQVQTNKFFAILLLIVIVTLVFVQLLHAIRVRLMTWHAIEMRGQGR